MLAHSVHSRKMVSNKIFRLIRLGLFLASGAALFAQLPTAAILGVVKDTSGAVVPGATITARNAETGLTRSAVSESNGS